MSVNAIQEHIPNSIPENITDLPKEEETIEDLSTKILDLIGKLIKLNGEIKQNQRQSTQTMKAEHFTETEQCAELQENTGRTNRNIAVIVTFIFVSSLLIPNQTDQAFLRQVSEQSPRLGELFLSANQADLTQHNAKAGVALAVFQSDMNKQSEPTNQEAFQILQALDTLQKAMNR